MGRNQRLSPFLTDFATTVATSVAITVCLLLITRMVATRWGPEDLGLYVLFRRVGAFLVPASTLMVSIGLTRAVAMAKDHDRSLVQSAAVLGLAATTATCALLMLAPILQPDMSLTLQRIVAITPAIVAFLYANLIFTLAYSWYRGTGQMHKANAWQLLSVALAPLALTIAFAGSWTITFLLSAIAAAYALPVGVVAGLVRPRAGDQGIRLRPQVADLARYCLPRIPGSLGLTAILALAPLAAALNLGLAQSGYLGAGQAIFAVSEGGATALSLLLLPKLAALLAEGRTAEIRERVSEMTVFLVQVGLPVSLVVPLFAREIVNLWLGSQYAPAATVMKIYCLGLFPYVSYVALRSVLDATEVRALNTISILTALGLQAVALFAAVRSGLAAEHYAATTTLAMAALGAQSYYFVWRRGALALRRAELLAALGGVALVLGPVLAVELAFADGRATSMISVVKAAVFATGLVVYLFTLWRGRSRWVVALRRRIRPGD